MSDGFKGLRLYNTLTRAKEDFVPIDANNVRMYVCGPTVYDYAHIGNARPAIVFDVLFRLLRHLYGEDQVTYVRNITDVDDKINARALRDYGADIAAGTLSLNDAIRKVTEPTYEQYQKDVTALGCLPPTVQPRATEFVLPRADGKADMVTLIQSLIDRGHAYVSNGEVLFDVSSMADYGQLSKRPLDEQQAGARIAVEAHKKNPADFVLWKQSSPDEPGWEAHFDAPAGHVHIHGRPGWHIECSAMSAAYLGDEFDIHGGGLDLIFPHHENEIAQSRCAHGTEVMANYWLHNGFLQVEGKKMSKSDGNFVTIHELLAGIGRRPFAGEVIRLTMLATHYRQPIDFGEEKLLYWTRKLADWVSLSRVFGGEEFQNGLLVGQEPITPSEEVREALSDDLNFQLVIKHLDELASKAPRDPVAANAIARNLIWLGLYRSYLGDAYYASASYSVSHALYEKYRDRLEDARALALNDYEWLGDLETRMRSRNSLNARFQKLDPQMSADGVRLELDEHGGVSMLATGATAERDDVAVETRISQRLALIAAKNWPEADRIRDELLAQGIQLKDGKDPATGARITTWEVKR